MIFHFGNIPNDNVQVNSTYGSRYCTDRAIFINTQLGYKEMLILWIFQQDGITSSTLAGTGNDILFLSCFWN